MRQAVRDFSWNFAQEGTEELQEKWKLNHDQARQEISWEMKHERANITEHYLGNYTLLFKDLSSLS
jgi:hypothetical protein